MNNHASKMEKIIEAKLDVILSIPSLEKSLAIHLDTYYQILKLIESENSELYSKLDNLIEKSLKINLNSP